MKSMWVNSTLNANTIYKADTYMLIPLNKLDSTGHINMEMGL